MAWLLDTNIRSERRKPKPEPRVTAFYEAQPLGALYISVVSIFSGRILPVTEDILLKWRTLMEDGRKTGHTYSHPDLVLAATALHHGLTVVTRDQSDFDKARVPVFNPWEK